MRYLGIDWATELHVVALTDGAGKHYEQWEVEHSRQGVDGLLRRLAQQGGPTGIRIAIESGAPLLVDQLKEAGYPIFVINPKQADRFRDRHSPAGCKDDRRDARALADALRTDQPWLAQLVPDSPETQELLRRTRTRTRLVQQRVRVGLQLRDTLARYYPVLLALGRKMHDAFVLALLKAYPTPDRGRRSQRTRLERIVREHRIRKLDAAQLQELLHEPGFWIAPDLADACADEACFLVDQIRLLNDQIAQIDARLAVLLKAHPDCELMLSLPGIAAGLAPGILAELGDDANRRTQPAALTVYAGTAPVTRATGTKKRPRKHGQRASVHVAMRRGCNRRLQTLLWQMARTSVATSAWARAYVDHRLGQGHAYNAIIRALSNKWAKILARMLETRTPYDEDLHIEHLRQNRVPWAPPAELATEDKDAA